MSLNIPLVSSSSLLIFCLLRLEQLAIFFPCTSTWLYKAHHLCFIQLSLTTWSESGLRFCSKHSNYTKLHYIQGMWKRPNTDVTVNLQKTSDGIMYCRMSGDGCKRTCAGTGIEHTRGERCNQNLIWKHQ